MQLTCNISTLLMKLDLPTFGKPQMRSVRVFGSMEGRRDRCCLTCSRYDKLWPWRFMIVHILQQIVSNAVIGEMFTLANKYKDELEVPTNKVEAI